MRGDDGLYVFWWSWRKISVDGQHPNPVGGLFCRSEGSEPSAREDSSARRSDHGYDQVLKAFLEAVVSDSVPVRFRGTRADKHDMLVLGRKQVLRRNFRALIALGGQRAKGEPSSVHLSANLCPPFHYPQTHLRRRNDSFKCGGNRIGAFHDLKTRLNISRSPFEKCKHQVHRESHGSRVWPRSCG